MNLVMAWTARVSVDGDRDGVFSMQIIPGKPNRLVVQTFKGAVYLYDADSGDLAWKTNVGVPYWDPQPAGFNSQSIFVTRRNILYVLNRANGTQRVFTYNEILKQADFGFELSFTPSATLVADEDFVYVPMGERLHALYIPDFQAIEKARKTMATRKDDKDRPIDEKKNLIEEDLVPTGPDSPQPVFYFGYRFANEIMNSAPLIYGDQISMLTTDGTLTSVDRYEKGPRKELFEFQVHGRALGGAGQYNEIAYLASSDFNLYAINMNGGKLVWRYVSGAPILRKPEVNDNDIFIAPDQVGLRRLDRAHRQGNLDQPRYRAHSSPPIPSTSTPWIGSANSTSSMRGEGPPWPSMISPTGPSPCPTSGPTVSISPPTTGESSACAAAISTSRS